MVRALVLAFGVGVAIAVVAAMLLGRPTTRAAIVAPEADGLATPTPGGLPDLTIQFLQVTLETGGDCNFTSTTLGVRVFFANGGDGDAPAFDVEVNGAQQTYDPGLPSGAKGSLWFAGFVYLGDKLVRLDPDDEVAESDETNNAFSGTVAIPTLPPTCTPTPSATPTATPNRPEILGDVDGNGTIDSLDALFILWSEVGIFPPGYETRADVNGDGFVNAIDAFLVLQFHARLIPSLPPP